MAELTLTNEDLRELLLVLNVALYDTQALAGQSHDPKEVKAYQEHQATIRTWIHRFSTTPGTNKGESALAHCPYCKAYHNTDQVERCPLKPTSKNV